MIPSLLKNIFQKSTLLPQFLSRFINGSFDTKFHDTDTDPSLSATQDISDRKTDAFFGDEKPLKNSAFDTAFPEVQVVGKLVVLSTRQVRSCHERF